MCYKIQYSPYDIISKLPNRYLHFFCALDHLHRDVEIDFSKLHQHDKAEDCLVIVCPFNCILKSDNYINAIERIVQEKSSVLKNLSEMPAQKLLNMATSDCAMTVLPTNLLTLVRMLETFWHDKEQFIEKKDIGKLATNINQNKTIDWHQLCLDIIDYDTNTEDEIERIDEYEPTLNKEERIRAQDVFVVNLPTLNFTLSTQLTNCTDLVLYKGYKVPKQLVENELRRDAILQKVLR